MTAPEGGSTLFEYSILSETLENIWIYFRKHMRLTKTSHNSGVVIISSGLNSRILLYSNVVCEAVNTFSDDTLSHDTAPISNNWRKCMSNIEAWPALSVPSLFIVCSTESYVSTGGWGATAHICNKAPFPGLQIVRFHMPCFISFKTNNKVA